MSNHYGSIQNLGTANPQNISVLHDHAHFRPKYTNTSTDLSNIKTN